MVMNFQTKSSKRNDKGKYFEDPAEMDLKRPVIVVFVFVRYRKSVPLGVTCVPDNHHQKWEKTCDKSEDEVEGTQSSEHLSLGMHGVENVDHQAREKNHNGDETHRLAECVPFRDSRFFVSVIIGSTHPLVIQSLSVAGHPNPLMPIHLVTLPSS